MCVYFCFADFLGPRNLARSGPANILQAPQCKHVISRCRSIHAFFFVFRLLACLATTSFMAQMHLPSRQLYFCFSGTPVLQFTTSQLTVVETRTLDHRKEVHALSTSSTVGDISATGEDVPEARLYIFRFLFPCRLSSYCTCVSRHVNW